MSEKTPEAYLQLGEFEGVADLLYSLIHEPGFTDPNEWPLSEMHYENVFHEHDGLSLNNEYNGAFQHALLTIADACAESFLQRFARLKTSQHFKTPWGRECGIQEWKEVAAEDICFLDRRRAAVWFTWDLMVPSRFKSERFDELALRAVTLFAEAGRELEKTKEHGDFALLLANCCLKLCHNMKNDDREEPLTLGQPDMGFNFTPPSRPKV